MSTTTEDNPVDLKEAVKEQKTSKAKPPPDVVKQLVPTPVQVQREFNDGNIVKTYTQKGLTYFAKMELFQTVGMAVRVAMQGTDGISVDSMLSTISSADSVGSGMASNEADNFVKGISTLMVYVPELMKDIYAIALNVPHRERAWFKDRLDDIDDDTGFEIMELFVKQNEQAIRDFFGRFKEVLAEVRPKPDAE